MRITVTTTREYEIDIEAVREAYPSEMDGLDDEQVAKEAAEDGTITGVDLLNEYEEIDVA